jgi:hypothetical protein
LIGYGGGFRLSDALADCADDSGLRLCACVLTEAAGAHSTYEIVLEQRASALLRVDWKGAGRDVNSGKPVNVPEADPRRNSYVSVNFGAKDPMLWRSNLLRRLKNGNLTPADLHVEAVGHANLVRAYVVREPRLADAFFKKGAAASLDANDYVAECFVALESENGAVECSTQLTVDSYTVKVTFDLAFLWDFDELSTQAVAAAKHYLAKPSTRQAIEGISRR